MSKSPAFQWYPRDILSSARVQQMTLAEEGAYRRLLDYCWLNGSVPSDPARAARLIGKGATVRMAKRVISMFQPNPTDPSTLIHDRLEAERVRQNTNRDKKVFAATSRWKGNLTNAEGEQPQGECNADASANAVQVECLASSSSSSSANKDKRVSRDTWLTNLQSQYAELDVRACYASAEDWYQANAVTLTRDRFVRWLNSEKRKKAKGDHASARDNGHSKGSARVGTPSPPPAGCGKPVRYTYDWPRRDAGRCCEDCLTRLKLSAAALNEAVTIADYTGEAMLCP